MSTNRFQRVRRFLIGALVVVGLLVGVWGLQVLQSSAKTEPTTQETKEIPPIPVTVEAVQQRPIERSVVVVGSLYGQEEIPISPKVEGRVVKIFQQIGDRVEPGTKLLEIDPTDYRLAVEEAKRALDLELSRLGLQSIPAGKFDVSQLPAVVRAASMERNAQSRRDRIRKLASSVAATQEDIDQAETDFVVARANYRQAVLEAESTVASARYRLAMLETAQQRLRDTLVIAPPTTDKITYVITARKVAEGEIVRIMPGADSMLFQLIVDDPLKLKVTVAERHKNEVQLGQPVQIAIDSDRNTTYEGKVMRINPAIDRASRTFEVEIHVPNADRRLSAGGFAKATIITNRNAKGLAVPEEAIVRFAGVTKLFIVNDDKVRQVSVSVGAVLEEERNGSYSRKWVEVVGALKPGDRVVVTGHSKLVEGSAVRVRTSAEGKR